MWMEFLSRLQFALTISFHILFPAFSVGLATFLVIMEAVWLKTKNPLFLQICKFWTKVFALTFGMGVVSGIAMEFQLGTNWSGFTDAVGPVLGSLFVYEVLTAFFIEAGFLGIMIFGWGRLSKGLHFLATFLVWFGVTLSAFWILSANSWMQAPSGAVLEHGRFHVTSWLHVIFNPTVIPRYIHMLLAAYLSTVMVIAAVSGWYLLRKIHIPFAKTCFSFAMWAMLLLIPIQMFVGDMVGSKLDQYQPVKTAAIEAVWHTQKGAPFVVFAWPDESQQKNLFAIKIPYAASLINKHSIHAALPGLNTVPKQDWPDVPIVFFTFRIMVGMGMLILLLAVISVVLRAKKKLFDTPWFLRASVLMVPTGFIALLTGWYTAEVGRQPWVVYNILRTKDAVSHLQTWQVIASISVIILVYGLVFGVFYMRYVLKTIRKGPGDLAMVKMPFAYMAFEKDKEAK